MRVLRLALLLTLVLGAMGWYVFHARVRANPQVPTDICFVAPATPYDPASGIAPDAPRAVPVNARCPVCGAFPSRVPEWAAQVIFADGDAYFFDSPLSLFIYLRNLPRYAPSRTASEIAASYVRATEGGQWIATNEAVYVRGSSVPGPMRQGNLPAFEDVMAARHFISRHGGTVLHSPDITVQLLQDLAPTMHRAEHA
ncbi:hypothetical protein Cmtc_52140 [Cupriavidus sp. TKC]|nr:hypothetical protein Cmtc_52140 [Cupriavidus sp. TKC]